MGVDVDVHRIETRLSRDLGLLEVTMIGVGAMIGAGIFVLTGIAAGLAGPSLMLAFALNGVICFLTAMAYAELGSTFPEAGGGYLWVKKGLGGLNGLLSGWMSWFAHSVACSLYILGFGFYLFEMLVTLNLMPNIFVEHSFLVKKLISVAAAIVFGYINYLGASETGRVGVLVTTLKVVLLSTFVLAGIVVTLKNPGWTSQFKPFFANGLKGVVAAMGLTFVAFEGYEIIVQSGEEVKNPSKNIPRAVFLSILIVVPIYILVGFAALGAVKAPSGVASAWEYLSREGEGAMVEAARQILPYGEIIMIAGGLMATLSALNATIYSSSRVSFAMGRDRSLPSFLGWIHPRRRTPHLAIISSTAIIVFMAVLLPIEEVASAASVMFILLFSQVNLALVELRRKKPGDKRGFMVPLCPYIPYLAVLMQVVLGSYLFYTYRYSLPITACWILLGVLVYYGYSSKREEESLLVGPKRRESITARRYSVLLPIANPENIQALTDIASRVARSNGGEVHLLTVVEVPEQLPVSGGKEFVEEARSMLLNAAKSVWRGIPTKSTVRIGHSIPKAILETADEKKPSMIVMGWRGRSKTRDTILGSTLDPVTKYADTDVAVVKIAPGKTVRRVLLPVAGGPHSKLAAKVAMDIAKTEQNSVVTVISVLKPGVGGEEARRCMKMMENLFRDMDVGGTQIVRRVVEASSVVDKILEEAEKHDIIVIGASERGFLKKIGFGTIPEDVAKKSGKMVVMVKRQRGKVRSIITKLFKH